MGDWKDTPQLFWEGCVEWWHHRAPSPTDPSLQHQWEQGQEWSSIKCREGWMHGRIHKRKQAQGCNDSLWILFIVSLEGRLSHRHQSLATLSCSHSKPNGKCAASMGPEAGTLGPWGQVPSARLPHECTRHQSILSPSLYGTGPKSRSRATQEMCLQRMNQVFSLGK